MACTLGGAAYPWRNARRPRSCRSRSTTARKQRSRTQFLKRMVQFADDIGKPVQLLYYPPYHSKYNPIERCWGILEKHWNGAKLTDAENHVGLGRVHDMEGPATPSSR